MASSGIGAVAAERLADELVAAVGPVDVLINNAARFTDS
jgi:NAD(P)-dependent dehydrogenase (short-subunit alcohol dehydrogenase family)